MFSDGAVYDVIAVVENHNPAPDCPRSSEPPFVINGHGVRMYAMPPGTREANDGPRCARILNQGENTLVVHFWDSIPKKIKIVPEVDVVLKSLKMNKNGEEIELLEGATVTRVLMKEMWGVISLEPVDNNGQEVELKGGYVTVIEVK